MTLRKLPPSPSAFRSLDDWAQQIFEYLRAQAPISSVVAPTPLLLAHTTTSGDERAAEDGIMLFDPVLGYPVFSRDGVWYALPSGAWVIERFVYVAHASLYDEAILFSSLGAAWTPITNYASNGIPDKGITSDLVAGTMLFTIAGVYEVSVAINLSHNESNQGRETQLRFFNVTDGVPSGEIINIAIGRNQPGLNYFIAFPTEITDADLNKEFRLEMGNGDSISSITGSIEFFAKSIGDYPFTPTI